MNTENLLRAVRPVHLLIPRPVHSTSTELKFWSMQLDGLHQNCLKASAKALRDARKRPGQPVSEDASLKVSGLHHGLAKALGARSFDAWRDSEQEIVAFLLANGMNQPANLISWSRAPSRLTARQLSDRLFNSALPMPEKIFTGVGSNLFVASGRGRIDIHELSGGATWGDEAKFNWCEARANQTVLSLERELDWDADAPDAVELSGRDLLLHAYRFDHIAVAFNLLSDNLVAPMLRPPEFRLYNASEDDLTFDLKVFDIFREEIERSESGWVEVVKFPKNDQIIFLKGANGAFDWVIRDQREAPFSGNPYHPILKSHELPTVMKASELSAHLYFKTGEWQERLEHEAETRHYVEGGTAATWPGYSKLIERELTATRGYVKPGARKGRKSINFLPHRLSGYCLMVSPLITIKEFWRFLEGSDWQDARELRLDNTRSSFDLDLAAVNLRDADHLPVCVTWFDAVAFCKYYEDKTDLPVRLLEVDEWKLISPSATEAADEMLWCSEKYSPKKVIQSNGSLRFSDDLTWGQNREGLSFLSAVDFGEWLADYSHGQAPAANAVTGQSLQLGPLERALCRADSTMRYKGMKVGFRLCYVAHPDA